MWAATVLQHCIEWLVTDGFVQLQTDSVILTVTNRAYESCVASLFCSGCSVLFLFILSCIILCYLSRWIKLFKGITQNCCWHYQRLLLTRLIPLTLLLARVHKSVGGQTWSLVFGVVCRCMSVVVVCNAPRRTCRSGDDVMPSAV